MHIRYVGTALVASASVGLVACGSEAREQSVESVAEGLPVWEAVEELRIGSPEGDDALARTGSHLITVSDEGTVYVGQPQTGEIRVFDSQGGLLTVLGGRGEGPGEFSTLSSVGIAGDELYGTNTSGGRVEFFSLSGEHLRTRTYGVADYFDRPLAPVVVFDDGSGIVSLPVPAGTEGTFLSLHVDSGQVVLDTVLAFPTSTINVPVITERMRASVRQPFGSPPPTAVSESGTVLWTVTQSGADRDSLVFLVERRDREGGTGYLRRYAYVPVEIPPTVRDSVTEVTRASAERFIPEGAELDRIMEQLFIPTHYPPVAALRSGDGDSLWLLRTAPPGAPSQTWELHDAAGDPVGSLGIPGGGEVVMFRGDQVWALELDQLDIPYVVRYRIIGR